MNYTYIYIYVFERLFKFQKFSAFADLLMEKPDN